jgi:GGDEF domain-containing protein
MPNEFLEFADSVKDYGPPQKTVNEFSEFASTLDSNDSKKSVLSQSMYAAMGIEPDADVKVQQIAAELGIGVDLTRRNFDVIKRKSMTEGTDWDSMIRDTPKTAAFLEDKNNMALVRDDLDATVKAEKAVKKYGTVNGFYRSTVAGFANMNALLANIPAGIYTAAAWPQNQLAKIDGLEWMGVSASQVLKNPVTDYYNEQAKLGQEFSPNIDNAWNEGNYGQFLWHGFLQNAPTSAALLVGAATGAGTVAMAGVGSGTAGQVEAKSTETGLDPGSAATNALVQGSAEALFERVGSMGILKHWEKQIAKQYGKEFSTKVFKEFFNSMLHSVVVEGIEEGLTEITQQLSDYVTGVTDSLEGFWENVAKASLAGAFAGGVQTAPISAASGYAKASNQKRMLPVIERSAENSKNSYLEFGASVDGGKLKERSPEKQALLNEEVLKDSGMEKVYIPVDAMESYFQSANEQETEGAEAMPGAPAMQTEGINIAAMKEAGVLEAYNLAKENGLENVEIPMGEWVAKSGDHFKALADDVKFDPENYTTNQVKQIGAELSLVTPASALKETKESKRDTAKDVGFDIQTQLENIGQDSKQASTNAKIWENFFRTMSRKSGVDATELYDRYKARIEKVSQEELNKIEKEIDEDFVLAPEETADLIEKDESGLTQEEVNELRAEAETDAKLAAMAETGGLTPVLDALRDIGGLSLDSIKETGKAGEFNDMKYYGIFKKNGSNTVARAIEKLKESGVLKEASETELFDRAVSEAKSITNFVSKYGKNKYAKMRRALEQGPIKARPTQELVDEIWNGFSDTKKKQNYFVDPVTGTMNRRAWDAMAAPEGKPNVALVSVEGIKYVNDNISHDAGDDLYRIVGQAIKAIDPGIAKVGGDFAIHVKDQAEIDQLLANVKKTLPEYISVGGKVLDSSSFEITGSVGESLEQAAKVETAAKSKAIAEGRRADPRANKAGTEDADQEARRPKGYKEGDKASEISFTPAEITAELESAYSKLNDAEAKEGFSRDPQSGFLTYEAYKLLPVKAARMTLDLNGLGILNKKFGKGAGDMLLKGFDKKVKALIEIYGQDFSFTHKSGDEYLAQSEDFNKIKEFSEKLEKFCLMTDVDFSSTSNVDYVLSGITFGAGIGGSDGTAENNLKTGKENLAEERNERGILRRIREKGSARIPDSDRGIDSGNTGVVASDDGGRKRQETSGSDASTDRGGEGLGIVGRAIKAIGDIFFQSAPEEKKESHKLSALHNLSADNLKFADKMGGLAVPSISVIPENIDSPTGFGEITLIGGKDLADPEKNPVFDRDAYSPRFPKAEYKKANYKEADKVFSEFREVSKKFEESTYFSDAFDESVNKANPENAIRRLIDLNSSKAAFLETKGIKVEPIKKKAVVHGTMDKKLAEAVEKYADADYDDTDSRKKLAEEFVSAVKRWSKSETKDPVLAEDLERTMIESMVDEDGLIYFGKIYGLKRGAARLGTLEINEKATKKSINKAMSGLEAEFKEWLKDKIMSLHGDPFITLGGKKVPYALGNIVKSMSGKVKGQEKGMVEGVGKTAATAAEKFESLDEMRELASENIVNEKEIEQHRIKAKASMDAYHEEAMKMFKGDSGFDALDASMRSIQKWLKGSRNEANMRKALADEYFSVSNKLVSFAIEAAADLMNSPVSYFESKPQRSVGLGEFFGAVVPEKTDKETLDILEKHGIQVLKYKPNSGPKGVEGDARAKAVRKLRLKAYNENKDVLFQKNNQKARARFIAGENLIQMLPDADASSFIHESAHFFLEVMRDLAKESPEVAKELEIVKNWTGAGDKFTRENHEQFARGFEKYLAEGVAPSEDMRGVFARFRVWLVKVYKDLKKLDVTLTPEVTDMFDRLLASEENINEQDQTEPLEGEPDELTVAREEARQAADDYLRTRLMNDYNRELTSQWKDKKAEIQIQIEHDAKQMPVYRAIGILKDGLNPDGSKAQAIKLSKAETVGKNLPRGIVSDDGLHPDIVAEALGFDSGEDMLRQLANTTPMKEFVKTRLDFAMSQEFPDLMNSENLPEEAVKALHNDKKALYLRKQFEFMADKKKGALKEGIRQVTRRLPGDKTLKAQAAEIIGHRSLRDLKPNIYKRYEINAAKRAGVAFAKGDFDAAMEAKYQERLNFELYRQATEAKEYVDEAIEKFKKTAQSDEKLAKRRDIDLVNAARAVLASFKFGTVEDENAVFESIKQLRVYDAEMAEEIEALIQASTREAKDYRDTTFGTFKDMAETVEALWDLSLRSRQVTIDGKKRDKDEVVSELNNVLSEMTKPQKDGLKLIAAEQGKWRMRFLGAKAALRRVESWTDQMGPDFKRYIWNPVSESVDKYREAKKEKLEKFLEIVKTVEPDLKESKEIAAPEIGAKFKGMGELLHALLHNGNRSNLQKLLLGYGWGDINEMGELNTSKWDSFIKRMQDEGVLQKRHYEFAQAIWNLNESLKPGAQKAHKDMYGYHFKEVETTELVTPFGVFTGGYVPAIADPYLVSDAAIRQEKESLEKTNNSYMFPTTGRGFTKGRVTGYNKPLSLDLRLLPSHIDKVLRFTHIEPAVKDVGRIVVDRQFRDALQNVDPTAGGDMLTPWLQRAAQQTVSTPTSGWGGRAIDSFFKEVRNRTGLQLMAANVVNTLQQVAGLSLAAVKVKPVYLKRSLWNYMKHPKDVSAQVSEKSEFMRNRVSASVMEVQNTIEDLILNPSKYDDVRNFAKRHGYFLQAGMQGMVDAITWQGAYDQAVESGYSETDAVRSANEAVRLTQGSFAPEDLSRFETGTPVMRAFTMFYSYFNMNANLIGGEFAKTIQNIGLKKGAGRLLYVYTLGFMAPAVVAELISRGIRGGGDDDEDEIDAALSVFFGSQFRLATAMVPVVGQMANVAIGGFTDTPYDDKISSSPAISMIESSARTGKNVYETIMEDKDWKGRDTKDLLTLLGLMSGVPLRPLSGPINYLTQD